MLKRDLSIGAVALLVGFSDASQLNRTFLKLTGIPSRTSFARQAKTFTTESEAKQFAKAKLAEGMKVTAGTLVPHQPVRRIIAASEIKRWIDEEV